MTALMAILSCPVFVSCSDEDIPEDTPPVQPSDPADPVKPVDPAGPEIDAELIASLERSASENMTAISSLIGSGYVKSCADNAGKVTIELMDGSTYTVDPDAAGLEVLTVMEEGGSWCWGIISSGKAVALKINGNAIAATTVPDVKISEEGEWLVSTADGTAETGLSVKNDSDNSLKFFKDAAVEDEMLVLSFIAGAELSLPVVGEGIFRAEQESIWFTRLKDTKGIALTAYNVKEMSILSKPEGWEAEIIDNILRLTSPETVSDENRFGLVELTAVFEGSETSVTAEVEVQFDHELAIEADAYGLVKASVSEHVDENHIGYLIEAWETSAFSSEAALEWLNGDGRNSDVYTGSRTFDISEIADDFVQGRPYMVFAVPAAKPEDIASGADSYTVTDLYTAAFNPTYVTIDVSDIRFDYAHISTDMNGISEYHAGIAPAEDWKNYLKDNFLEMLGWGLATPLDAQTYNGPAAMFPNNEQETQILPSTEYTVWVLPVSEDGVYTDDDFITKSFTTPAIYPESSTTVPSYEIKDVTYSGFKAEVSPAAGAYKTFATILPAASIPDDETETVSLLIKTNKYSEGTEKLSVSNYNFNPESDVYLLAVTVNPQGGYGNILKERVELKQLVYSDNIGISGCEISYGVGDVTLKLDFIGAPETITYMAASYTFYTDETIEKMMAMDQLGDVKNKRISSLTDGNSITFKGLEVGTPYIFYAIVKDSDKVPSRMYTIEFTPCIGVDYIMSNDDSYTYGMPSISGEWSGKTTYLLNVDKPAECVTYWLTVCDSEYLTGDMWTDTDKLITSTLYNSAEYKESITGKKFTYLNSATRVYIAWLDDMGNYHAIYEFDPH